MDSPSVEATLFEIWREVLGVEVVSASSNFFELGGDSIQGVLAISNIQAVVGVEISLADIFEASTLGGLNSKILDLYKSSGGALGSRS